MNTKPTQDTLDEIYQRLLKDGGDVGESGGYVARMFDLATIRNVLNNPDWNWPRLRDLPQEEQGEFKVWLMVNRLNLPLLDMVLATDQDAYYPHDYDDWKNGREALRNYGSYI